MNIWISGTLNEVKQAAETKLVNAVVTNPTVIADWTKNTRSLEEVSIEVINATGLPLYIQLQGPTTAAFLKEAEHLKKISGMILPKLPSTLAGLSAAKELEANGCETLVTTVVSINQAYACAAAGVTTICPYLNRLLESGEDALEFIRNVAKMFNSEKVHTKIVPASVRTTSDIENALINGCSGVIIFYPLFVNMFEHQVTASSLAEFENDWKKIPYQFRDGQNT
ncbi:MAG: transaldolase family protein [Chitinophagaceae bacterium]